MSKLQYLFSEYWSVRRSALSNLVSVVAPCIVSGNPAGADAVLAEGKIEAMCASMQGNGPFTKWDLAAETLPEGSVVAFRLTGMLYRWMTSELSDMLDMAETNPNISGIILTIDGPGGMAGGVPALAEKIRSLDTPVVTLIAGEMCSAHLWIGASARRVFAASRYCEVGSIGAMTTFTSYRKYLESQGIEDRDIYPDTSDLKNKEYRDLEDNGDDSAVKQRLEELHRNFVAHVAKCRGLEADISKDYFRGMVMQADKALKAGLVDEIGGMDSVMRWLKAQKVIAELPEEYR
ncbi:MAG: S49 family peptidase [Muribaculaceae bacterium]|nr:S49 family peptidase [Muribaculaceae bacterium]